MVFQYDEELILVFGLLAMYGVVVFILSIYLQIQAYSHGVLKT